MNKRPLQRSHSVKFQAPSSNSSTTNNYSNTKVSSSLPEAFISSLRQLFSILDKTNCGYVPVNVFKRYFDCSSSTSDFLNQLEMESKSNNDLITFDLLINVIERSLLTIKSSSSIVTSKVTHPLLTFPLNRSTSLSVVSLAERDVERDIPVSYRTSDRLEFIDFNSSNFNRSKKRIQRNTEGHLSMV